MFGSSSGGSLFGSAPGLFGSGGGGSGLVGSNGPIPANNADSSKLVLAIQNQTAGIPAHLVYVIDIVSVKFGGYFTADVRA